MWNPSRADVAEILMLKRAHPAIAKHMDTLLEHLAVATRKIEFYEKIANPDTIAKAAAAGLAGMSAMEKATFLAKSTRSEQRLPLDGRLAEIATPAESAALAKRAQTIDKITAAGAPLGKVMLGGGVVDSSLIALVKGADKMLPAGHCGLNR